MSVHSQIKKLIKTGPRVRCSLTGAYFPRSETVADGKGNRRAKVYDWFLKPGEVTKYRNQKIGEFEAFLK